MMVGLLYLLYLFALGEEEEVSHAHAADNSV